MTRLIALLVAVAALVFAPAALASTYTVNDAGDAPDALPGDDICATAGAKCTLRAAIEESNAHLGTDTIVFDPTVTNVQAHTAFNGSDTVTDTTTIDGSPATTVTFDATADGPLFAVSATSSTLKGLTFTGGKSGPVVQLDGSGATLSQVTIHDTPGVAIQANGPSAQLASITVSKPGGTGIVINGNGSALSGPSVSGAGAAGISIAGGDVSLASPVVSASSGTGIAVSGQRSSISSPDVSGATDGIVVTGDSAQVSGGTIHGNSASGIAINAQHVVVSRVLLYDDAGHPITVAPGANGGITPPPDLRIGPRRQDGSLPLTGTAPVAGSVELWSGNPFGALAPSFLDSFSVPAGAFSYNFASEPPPGATFALTLTGDGTSEFATVTVPSDVVSPDLVKARALSTTQVRVTPTEPLDANSVQPADFTLTMAGQDRPVIGTNVAPDGTYVDLTSSGWKAGEAGYVQLSGAGAINDVAGNASLATTRLRVAAAPGDFIAPIAGQFALSPSNICLTHGRSCHTPGTVIRFVTTEAGKATLVIQRGDKRVGTRIYNAVAAGPNALRFNGRLSGRKLRAGRYRVLLYVQDLVGNVTDQPPIALMNVRRVSH